MRNYFPDKELMCPCGCGKLNFDQATKVKFNIARENAGIPFKVNSACRCEKHNKEINGSPTSSHLLGLAMDIETDTNIKRFIILKALIDAKFVRIEIGLNYIHADNDKNKLQEICWLHPKLIGEKK